MRAHRRFSHSLSGRLILIFIGMGVLFLVLVGGTIGQAVHTRFDTTLRPHVMKYLAYVESDIGVPPNYSRATELSRALNVTIYISGPHETWSSSGELADVDHMEVFHHVDKDGRAYAYGRLNGREFLRVQTRGYTYAYAFPPKQGEWRVAVPLLVLLLILAMLYHAIRKLFAPVQTIKAGVERIGNGDLDHRITVCRADELGELATSINAMAEDVKQMLDSKRQLLLAISHELRSPLTRAKVATGLVEDESQRLEIERELNDLEKLIEELLETERLATRHQALQKQRVNLSELVRNVAQRVRGPKQPTLHIPRAPIEAEVDPIRIRLLLRNLIENAQRHTPAQGEPPVVRLEPLKGGEGEQRSASQTDASTKLWLDQNGKARSDGVVLTVFDYGPGIPSSHLPYVTEPFYRVDPARQRETGGYGLGLYLCRRIAEVHGGRLTVSSIPNRGTEVRVVLPR